MRIYRQFHDRNSPDDFQWDARSRSGCALIANMSRSVHVALARIGSCVEVVRYKQRQKNSSNFNKTFRYLKLINRRMVYHINDDMRKSSEFRRSLDILPRHIFSSVKYVSFRLWFLRLSYCNTCTVNCPELLTEFA